MNNADLAKVFYEIADILDMQQVEFKPRAYRKAARSIETLSEDAADIYAKGGIKALQEIPGVGEKIAEKIEELLKTGKLKYYNEIKAQIPNHLSELMQLQGLGPRRVKFLNEKLKITTIKQLEDYAKQGKIRELEGFGEKSEKDILSAIELFKKGQERRLISEAYPLAKQIENALSELSCVGRATVAGSLRRMKETIGDIDILCTSKSPEKVMDFFTKMRIVSQVLAKGETKSTVILNNNMQADVRVVAEDEYGAAMQYFTGSQAHNVALRQIAIKGGYKLSEYGLFDRKTDKRVAGRTEEEVYRKLGMDYIEPELRENTGEIESAKKGGLPKLISYNSIKGDLHMHTRYSDGSNSIEEMAIAAKNMGYEYICITDHSKSQTIANGMDEKVLEKYLKEISQVNKKVDGIRIFTGSEVDIKRDGSLDYSNSVLEKLDIVIASVHSGFKMPEAGMTARIEKALSNEHVSILDHPTGRLINRRNGYNVNLDKIFDAAKANNVILEINAFPERLDLNDVNTKAAIGKGLKIAINTDAHSTDHLRYMFYGIATARRGWAGEKDVVNCSPLKQLPRFFKNLKI